MATETLADFREKKVKESIEHCDFIKLLEIQEVNHKPHPYIIGPKHVTYASDHCCGRLGEDVMNALPSCKPKGYYGPDVYLKDITFDRVCFMQLTRSVPRKEFLEGMQPAMDEWEKAGIDGMVFVETDEGYRVIGEDDDTDG